MWRSNRYAGNSRPAPGPWVPARRQPGPVSALVVSCSAMKLLVKWFLSASALLAVAYLYGGVQLNGFTSALIAAFVIGLFNTILRPILIILTLPVTLITLGLFLFVINALMFWAASGVIDGFRVSGFGAAVLGSLIYSAFGLVIESALERLFAKQ